MPDLFVAGEFILNLVQPFFSQRSSFGNNNDLMFTLGDCRPYGIGKGTDGAFGMSAWGSDYYPVPAVEQIKQL